jgi:hypothetical protein
MQQPFLATAAAVAGMFCSVLGWAFVLVGLVRLRKVLRRDPTSRASEPDERAAHEPA